MNPRTARQHSVDPTVRKHRPDYGLVIIASILLVIGLIVMFAISPALAALGGNVSDNYFVSRQFIAIILGCLAFFVASRISINTWKVLQKPLLIAALVLSLATLGFGTHLANRWIQLGAFSFQPVEFLKFTLVIVGSIFLAGVANEGRANSLKCLKPLLIAFVIFSFVVVVLQRDLGSAFVLFSMAVAMAFMAGVPLKRLAIFGLVAIILGVAAISSTAYRRDRFLTFMQPERDCVDAGYHACQALIAVGSGGVFGLGLGRSVQAYGYLPEAANDSIFAIYAEKFGFVGVVVLIGSLLLRILNIMQRAPNRTALLMCAAVFTWFGVQAVVNIGAMVGLLPLKGITLPFISYGGTSLIFAMAALGVVFNISSYTSMRKTSIGFDNERTGDESSRHWRRDSRPRYTVTRRGI
jgi:cell division protein FtsW